MNNEFDVDVNEKGIQGFSKKHFQADPQKVFGGEEVPRDLPEGARLYLKERALNFEAMKKMVVNVYRVLDDGGMKLRRVWVGKMPSSQRLPEADEVADLFGGGTFIWIAKWRNPDGTEGGIMSEQIDIDPAYGSAAKKSSPAEDAAPGAPSPLGDLGGVLRIMQASEEKTLAMFERMAMIFGGRKQDTPTEILSEAYKGAADMMKQAVEQNLALVKDQRKVSEDMMRAPVYEDVEEDGADGGAPESDPVPSWMRPWIPMIESNLERLLGGGALGGAVKTLILSSDDWAQIMGDPEKWSEAVSAMEQKFGSEKTRRAVEILTAKKAVAKKPTPKPIAKKLSKRK